MPWLEASGMEIRRWDRVVLGTANCKANNWQGKTVCRDVTRSYRGGGHLATLPRAERCCVAAAGKPRASVLPTAANGLHAEAGICWSCSFSSVCRPQCQQTHIATPLLLHQVKALLDALLGVWKDVAFVEE